MSQDANSPAVNNEVAEVAASDNVEKKMRLLIERHPNPDMTTYHIDRRLSDSTRSIDFTDESGSVEVDRRYDFLDGKDQTIEPFQQSLAEKIYRVPGVRKGYNGQPGVSFGRPGVSIDEYEITVTKGSAFDGLEVEDAVVAIIAQIFDLTVEELELAVNDKRHLLAHYQRLSGLRDDSGYMVDPRDDLM
jgi:hypothetical protein